MSVLRRLLVSLSGNRAAQNFLEYTTQKTMELAGIGSGGDVNTSGESAAIDKMKMLLSPPYCIFDVGANQGQFFNLLLSNIKFDQYQIHCFEPSVHTFGILTGNVKEHPNVVLNNLGLGKESGEFELYYNSPGTGIASLTKRRLDHFDIDFSKSERVRIETLDNYCQDKGITKIDLLKIDVEGHELDVLLSGSKKMFDRNAIKIVSFEFGGCNIDTRTFFQDFFYFFKNVDMNLFRITPSGYLYPIIGYREILEQFRTTNFLAVHNSLSL